MKTEALNSKNCKILGRHIIHDDVLYLSFSGSCADFLFNGTTLTMKIRTDRADDDIQRGILGVFVNNEFTKKLVLDKPVAEYEIYNNPSNSEDVLIRVIRFSENNFGKAGIISVTSDGELKPVAEKDLKIEFIGDSITCGYGVEGVVLKDNFSTATENPTKAYALKTVEILNADHSLCSWSGNGIITNYIPPEKDESDLGVPLMPTVYRYTDLAGAEFQNITAPEYDFDSFVPDVVVVNLGTNDQSYTRFKEDRVANFGKHYGEFIRYIRTKRPNSIIIGCLGVMGQDLCDEEARQFELLNDPKAFFLKLDQQLDEDGIAVDWHPSEVTHTKMSKVLSAFIKEKLSK
ncbi:MAG: GDSL-type esterase/lipase family protein [Lachnospiraceae bacterium]|nr:GDSL-type esterase/lipase family protein [Lachnospiraceae bacterium]